jgi:hypothetical protein
MRRIPALRYGWGKRASSGDEKFFTLSRQAKCIPLVATQSISSLKTTLPGETWRTLLQTFRTKIFLALADDFSAKVASDLCGQDEKWRLNLSLAKILMWAENSLFCDFPSRTFEYTRELDQKSFH